MADLKFGHSAGPTCITSGLYGESASGFGTLGRNTLRGPNYFDSDFSLMKYLRIPKWEQARFGLGAQFYNVFNHPNFEIPVANVGSSAFGQIIRTVSGQTPPFGAVLGADASPRIIQLKGAVQFLIPSGASRGAVFGPPLFFIGPEEERI
jgi:hypothetical protein